MIFETGDVVLVSHRRMFEKDEPRYFVGRLLTCEGPIIKIEGFTFVRDLSNGHIIKKDEKRIKVLSLDSPGHIVYELPRDVHVYNMDILSGNGDALLVDRSREIMNLSERTHCGHF